MSSSAPIPDCDEFIGGQNKSTEVEDVEDSIEIATSHSSVELTPDESHISVLVSSKHSTIDIYGGENDTVDLYLKGKHNSVNISDAMEVNTEHDTGSNNSVETDSTLIVDTANAEQEGNRLVRQSRDEALADAPLLGTAKISYQTDLTDDREWCKGCGEGSDNLIMWHDETVFSFFGLIFRREHFDVPECENCLDPDHIPEPTEHDLTEEERKDIYG